MKDFLPTMVNVDSNLFVLFTLLQERAQITREYMSQK